MTTLLRFYFTNHRIWLNVPFNVRDGETVPFLKAQLRHVLERVFHDEEEPNQHPFRPTHIGGGRSGIEEEKEEEANPDDEREFDLSIRVGATSVVNEFGLLRWDACLLQSFPCFVTAHFHRRGEKMKEGFRLNLIEQFQRIRLSSDDVPRWRWSAKGLGLEGQCQNRLCEAYGKGVIIQFGYCLFDFIRDVNSDNCHCPLCFGFVQPVSCALNNCWWRWSGQSLLDGDAYQLPHTLSGGWNYTGNEYVEFEQAKSPPKGVEWLRLTIEAVERDPRECCQICSQLLLDGRPTKQTNCHHYYHRECFQGWIQEGKICILCQSSFAVAHTPPNQSYSHIGTTLDLVSTSRFSLTVPSSAATSISEVVCASATASPNLSVNSCASTLTLSPMSICTTASNSTSTSPSTPVSISESAFVSWFGSDITSIVSTPSSISSSTSPFTLTPTISATSPSPSTSSSGHHSASSSPSSTFGSSSRVTFSPQSSSSIIFHRTSFMETEVTDLQVNVNLTSLIKAAESAFPGIGAILALFDMKQPRLGKFYWKSKSFVSQGSEEAYQRVPCRVGYHSITLRMDLEKTQSDGSALINFNRGKQTVLFRANITIREEKSEEGAAVYRHEQDEKVNSKGLKSGFDEDGDEAGFDVLPPSTAEYVPVVLKRSKSLFERGPHAGKAIEVLYSSLVGKESSVTAYHGAKSPMFPCQLYPGNQIELKFRIIGTTNVYSVLVPASKRKHLYVKARISSKGKFVVEVEDGEIQGRTLQQFAIPM